MFTPQWTYWYQSPSPLKLMIDRMVCADCGNPDPSSTHGKKVVEAKLIEQKGWDYPNTWPGGRMASSCMAAWQASSRTAATWPTGSNGWD